MGVIQTKTSTKVQITLSLTKDATMSRVELNDLNDLKSNAREML